MDWKDIASGVAKAAPILGTLLGGPAGPLIGAMAASVLGTTADPEAISQVLESPDTRVKLRQLELDHGVQLQAMVVRQAEVDAGDRADARKAQVQVRSWIPGLLAVGVTTGFFGVLALLLMGVWKASDNQALLILLGALGASWGAIINFYFGSSAGSARKDELLAQKG